MVFFVFLQIKFLDFEQLQHKRYSEAVPGAGPEGLRQAAGVFRQCSDHAETALRD